MWASESKNWKHLIFSCSSIKHTQADNQHKSLPWSHTWTWDLIRSWDKNHFSLKMNTSFIERSQILRVNHKGFWHFPKYTKKGLYGRRYRKGKMWETFWIALITTDIQIYTDICAFLLREQLFWNVEEKIVQVKVNAIVLLWHTHNSKNLNKLQTTKNEIMLKSTG